MIEAAILIAYVLLFVLILVAMSRPRRARCLECGEMVVADAKVCPHCGYRPEGARS